MIDDETRKRIDEYVDSLGIENWPPLTASQIDLVRRMLPTPTVAICEQCERGCWVHGGAHDGKHIRWSKDEKTAWWEDCSGGQ